jgi:hypothetical protein
MNEIETTKIIDKIKETKSVFSENYNWQIFRKTKKIRESYKIRNEEDITNGYHRNAKGCKNAMNNYTSTHWEMWKKQINS